MYFKYNTFFYFASEMYQNVSGFQDALFNLCLTMYLTHAEKEELL